MERCLIVFMCKVLSENIRNKCTKNALWNICTTKRPRVQIFFELRIVFFFFRMEFGYELLNSLIYSKFDTQTKPPNFENSFAKFQRIWIVPWPLARSNELLDQPCRCSILLLFITVFKAIPAAIWHNSGSRMLLQHFDAGKTDRNLSKVCQRRKQISSECAESTPNAFIVDYTIWMGWECRILRP